MRERKREEEKERERGRGGTWNDSVAYDVRNVHVTCTVNYAASVQ